MPGRTMGLVVAVTLLLLQGCGVSVAPEEKLVFHYSEGIQSLHDPTYKNLFLACHPEGPYRDLSARMGAYEEARRKGTVVFSPDAIELIKLGALGRGAYFRVREVEEAAETLRFKTLLKPDYLSINFTEFPPSAILYILAEPLGTVIRLKPGKSPGPERSVLQSVDLQWTWTRLSRASPADWCLQFALPIPESAVFKKLHFRESPLNTDAASP
jgi:hypothetical protein